MPALLFGSISTLVDTSELQRNAFNDAFAEHGLDWNWGVEEYRSLLTSNGGADRVAAYARNRGEDVDAAAVHATKSTKFQQALESQPLTARPGVLESVAAARDAGWPVGLVTTTSADNIDALLAGLAGQVSRDEFAVIVTRGDVDAPKPGPEAYRYALSVVGLEPDQCVAIEDNVGGVESARAAGVPCLAFPNENTAGHDFGDALVVERVDFASADDLVAKA